MNRVDHDIGWIVGWGFIWLGIAVIAFASFLGSAP